VLHQIQVLLHLSAKILTLCCVQVPKLPDLIVQTAPACLMPLRASSCPCVSHPATFNYIGLSVLYHLYVCMFRCLKMSFAIFLDVAVGSLEAHDTQAGQAQCNVWGSLAGDVSQQRFQQRAMPGVAGWHQGMYWLQMGE